MRMELRLLLLVLRLLLLRLRLLLLRVVLRLLFEVLPARPEKSETSRTGILPRLASIYLPMKLCRLFWYEFNSCITVFDLVRYLEARGLLGGCIFSLFVFQRLLFSFAKVRLSARG